MKGKTKKSGAPIRKAEPQSLYEGWGTETSIGWWGAEIGQAVIHRTAAIGDGVTIGAFTVIGPWSKIGARTKIWHNVNVVGPTTIGEDVMIAFGCQVDPESSIGDRTRIHPLSYVGRGCTVGKDVFLAPHVGLTNGRLPPSKRLLPSSVDDGAIVLAGSTILPGVRIGKRAVVAAGSIVTHDVADDLMVMGTPARPRGTRVQYDARMRAWDAEADADAKIRAYEASS